MSTHQSSNRICQNCKNDFTIEPDDFSFYEKIKVPPPTFCPECRLIRRMMWRNCRSLHKRTCDSCSKVVISMYSIELTPKVHCMECWNSDNRDPFQQGMEIDFSKNFFEQLNQLRKNSPILFAHHTGTNINSEYANYIVDNKNVYLCYSSISSEECMYSEVIDKSKNSFDNYAVTKVENCFQNVDGEQNFNCNFLVKSRNCLDSSFLYDCVNCSNCFMSSNLRNKQYVFLNKQLSQEEYLEKINEINLGSFSIVSRLKESFDHYLKNNAIHKFAQINNSEKAVGDYISNSRNIYYSFETKDSEYIKYSNRTLMNSKDSYDNQGLAQGELIYESVATSFGTFRDNFTYICVGSKECEYSLMCKNSSNCFGCVGLTNAQYCILNKQYSKEEYFSTIEKIKKYMNEVPYVDNKGRVFKYGEFFPYDLSPFGYNETNAHDFFSISKENAIDRGYKWHNREKRDYQFTIKSENLPDNIVDVDESILKEVISCPNDGNELTLCTQAYRIHPGELQFYKQKNLPLPRYCPNCRHYERLKYRNPLKLWHRECMCKKENHTEHNGEEKCKVEFETSYAPDRPEIVYCEKCYQQEVY